MSPSPPPPSLIGFELGGVESDTWFAVTPGNHKENTRAKLAGGSVPVPVPAPISVSVSVSVSIRLAPLLVR